MKLKEKDIELLKESLPVVIERYEYLKGTHYDYEEKEIKELNWKINKIKDLLDKL